MVSSSRSANIFREQIGRAHRKRRTMTLISTVRPWAGKSIRVRWYRLWTRLEARPQDGQNDVFDGDRATAMILSNPISMRSTLRPVGVSEGRRRYWRIFADSPKG
jgi:hypothetical protein